MRNSSRIASGFSFVQGYICLPLRGFILFHNFDRSRFTIQRIFSPQPWRPGGSVQLLEAVQGHRGAVPVVAHTTFCELLPGFVKKNRMSVAELFCNNNYSIPGIGFSRFNGATHSRSAWAQLLYLSLFSSASQPIHLDNRPSETPDVPFTRLPWWFLSSFQSTYQQRSVGSTPIEVHGLDELPPSPFSTILTLESSDLQIPIWGNGNPSSSRLLDGTQECIAIQTQSQIRKWLDDQALLVEQVGRSVLVECLRDLVLQNHFLLFQFSPTSLWVAAFTPTWFPK